VIVPKDVPILYYAGKTDQNESMSGEFLRNKNVNFDNLYNKPDDRAISASKLQFAKAFEGYSWLPKTVYTKKDAIDGAVGFPVIAKIQDGHSGLGIKKFDTAKDLQNSKEKFDIYCQFIDFSREYRILFVKDTIVMINERVPSLEDDKSIRTKDTDEKIRFVYVYQDLNKVSPAFIKSALKIAKQTREKTNLDVWSLDIVVDKNDKLWVMETSSMTGLGSVKMCELYKAIYEDFYKKSLPDTFLEKIYLEYVVPGHQNYWPKRRAEILKSPWAMDYEIITNPDAKDGYRYFFNLDKT
jgi:hypothetical protein